MSFTSISFLAFLPIVYCAYWGVHRSRYYQNLVLLLASLFFYGYWDWRFLALLLGSAILDYAIGLRLPSVDNPRARKQLLCLSLLCNLGTLALFKYFDFFAQSLAEFAAQVGWSLSVPTLELVLPIGISFYTFQTLSYTIDIYRNRLLPERDFVAFATYVAFFPQLVAGPIERATALLPQFQTQRRFDADRAADGCRQALWGFFKKMVVADNAARWVDVAYGNPGAASSWLLLYATVFFAIQIYCDFSGYSDIAIGIARLFGFELCQNFRFPYFARSIPEFWQRWHISLTTWFRDYVYIPLGGNRVSKTRRHTNIWVVFLVSGLWHGANWTFVVWGALHALFFFVLPGQRLPVREPSLRDATRILGTGLVVCTAWVFFRANSVTDAFLVLRGIVGLPSDPFVAPPLLPLAAAAAVFVPEWLQRRNRHALQIASAPIWWRWCCYYILVVSILAAAPTGGASFIYFQF